MIDNFNTVDNNLGAIDNLDIENNQTQTPPSVETAPPVTNGNGGGGTPVQKTPPATPTYTTADFLDGQQFFRNKVANSEAFRSPELFKQYRTIPGENTAGRLLDAEFGFSPILDNEDFYAQRQSGINKLGKGLLKLPLLVGTKLGSGVGFLAALSNPVNWFAEDGYISAVADNAISGFFDGWENDIKNNWMPTFQEAEDRDQGFFKSLGDANFWAEDVTDGLAFMASAWIPGLALGELGVGARAISSLARLGSVGAEGLGASIEAAESVANYFKNAAKYAKTIDKFNSWALATSSEAMFEAKGVKDSIMQSLEGSNYTEEEKKKIAGSNAKDAFLMNAVLLGATNMFELPLVNKLLGKAEGAVGNIGTMTRFGEDAAVREATTKFGKIIQNKYAKVAQDLISGTFREGFIEENGQLAIQKYHEELGAAGKIADILDLNNYANVAKRTYQQTKEAFGLGDKRNIEAEKSIGLGALLGGGQTAIANRLQSKREKLSTEQAITMYNQAQQSWLKFGNPYVTETVVSKDENGNEVKTEKVVFDKNNKPVVDNKKIDSIISSLSLNSAVLQASDNEKNMSTRNLLRDNAFADFVIAHIQIGQENKLKDKLDALRTASPEELAKFGFAPDETSQDQLNRYNNLANTIIKQNKIINDDILFDGTPEDEARKTKLTQLAAHQAVYRNLRIDESRRLDEIKNQLITPEMSSLSDGIVDQLNMLKFRIASMDSFIEDLKKNRPGQKTTLAVAEKNKEELEKEYDNLLKNNELSVKDLKQDDKGYYQYEKNERNEETILKPLVKRMVYMGSLENHIKGLGKEWASYADFKNGKKNFLENFDETITQPINNKIETDNQDRDITDDIEEPEENLEDLVDTSTLDEEPQDFDFLGNAIPSLNDYLKKIYDLQKSQRKTNKSFDDWKASEDANPFIKQYNTNYDKTEPLNTKKEEKKEDENIPPEDFVPGDEDSEDESTDLPEDFFGTEIPSIKLGPYTIHKGDLIDNELVNLITTKVIFIDGNELTYEEVLKKIDTFKGKNVKSKFTPPPPTTSEDDVDDFENGEIENPQLNNSSKRRSEFSDDLKNQINNRDETKKIVYGGSKKAVDGIKINNRSDKYEITFVKSDNIDRKRTVEETKYPLVLGTKTINIGSKLILTADYNIDDYEEENLLDPTDTVKRTRSDFFTGDNKIIPEKLDEFPIKIETIINGEKVELGHLPTMSWLQARYEDSGKTMNIVEFIKGPNIPQIDNLKIQVNKVKALRAKILANHNTNTKYEMYASVNNKSLGTLRLSKTKNKLSNVLHPNTKFGIVKNGAIIIANGQSVDKKTVIGTDLSKFKNIEGLPVFFIDTPVNEQLYSFASVPKLSDKHSDFIIASWVAFHKLNTKNRDITKLSKELEIVNAIYNAYGKEYNKDKDISFEYLKNYINDYITLTSSKKDYNPLLPEGTGRMNITPSGELVVWTIPSKENEVRDESKDKLFIKSLSELAYNNGEKRNALKEKLSQLYYTVKLSTDTSNGINSDVKLEFLSIENDKLVKSNKMTYNQYMMDILETNIEKGRQVDKSNPDSPYVHFANPVVNFSDIGDNLQELKDKEKIVVTPTPKKQPTATVSELSVNTAKQIEQALLSNIDIDNVVDRLKDVKDIVDAFDWALNSFSKAVVTEFAKGDLSARDQLLSQVRSFIKQKDDSVSDKKADIQRRKQEDKMPSLPSKENGKTAVQYDKELEDWANRQREYDKELDALEGKQSTATTPLSDIERRRSLIRAALQKAVNPIIVLIDGSKTTTRIETLMSNEVLTPEGYVSIDIIKQVISQDEVKEYGTGKILAKKGEVLYDAELADLDGKQSTSKKTQSKPELIITQDILKDISSMLTDINSIEDSSERVKAITDFVNSYGNDNLNKLGINNSLINSFLSGTFRSIAEVKDTIDEQISKAPLDKPINDLQIAELKEMYNTGFKERPDHKDWYVKHHLDVMEAIIDDLSYKYGGDSNMLKLMLYTHDLAKALNNEKQSHYDTIKPVLSKMGFSDKLITDVAKNLTLMDEVKTKKIDNLPIEVKIVSTADALSHYTTGKNGFLNIFSTITSKEDMSKIEQSNKAKIAKDQNKILLPGFDLSTTIVEYNGRVTYVKGQIPEYLNRLLDDVDTTQEPSEPSTTNKDILDLGFELPTDLSEDIGDIDEEPPFSVRTNDLKNVKKICK